MAIQLITIGRCLKKLDHIFNFLLPFIYDILIFTIVNILSIHF